VRLRTVNRRLGRSYNQPARAGAAGNAFARNAGT
jgi:hypothetical protein